MFKKRKKLLYKDTTCPAKPKMCVQHISYWKKWLTEKEKLLDHLNWKQNYLHFSRNIIFPWVNHRRTSYSHSEWKSHRHFLKNEWSVISRKTIGIIYCQWYNLIFHGENKNFRKLEFITASLAFFLVFKTFQMRLVALLIKLHFYVSYNEICQYLEDLYNFMNQYFPNDHCVILWNWTW